MTEMVFLEDVADDVTVGHVGPMADEYVPAGIPFLRSLNIAPHRIELSEVKYISPEFHSKLKKSALKPGDVVIVRTGKPGTCAVIPASLADSNCSDVVIVRCGPRLRPRFFAYWVNAVAGEHVSSHTVGAVQQHFNVGAARKMPIRLPSVTEQDLILSVLGALDDKIELNRKTAATLEEMARALYRSWFVDFDPVHAKAEGRAPAHMDAATAALFPDSFGEDGLPDGWAAEPFPTAIAIISGGTSKTSEPSFWGGNVPWYSVVDAPSQGQIFVMATEKTITNAGLNGCSARLVPKGTTIVSARGTVGKLAMAGRDMVFNQSCYGLRHKEMVADAFVYFTALRAVEQLQAMAHGSVFATITKKTFDGIDVVQGSHSVMMAFEAEATRLLSRVHQLTEENQTLATLRDTLMPRLMSGELRVGAAKELIEEVA